jgi:hypothetical protein
LEKVDKAMKLQLVKQIINCWDPIGLLSHCPSDEYDIESEEIWHSMNDSTSVEFLTQTIFNTFTTRFSPVIFEKTMHECEKVAIQIIEHLNGEKEQQY